MKFLGGNFRRIMKDDEEGNPRELTEGELSELEKTHPELCDWLKDTKR